METIQVVLDAKLLRAVRDALREHLRRLKIRKLEERDRKGYRARPQTNDEVTVWESEAAWPPQ
jgi:hypothetical protein